MIKENNYYMQIEEELMNRVGSKYVFTLNHVEKNNGIILTAISAKKKTENIGPNIYLNDFYEQEITIDEACDTILEMIYKNEVPDDIKKKSTELIDNCDTSRLFVKLVNGAKNEKLSKECVCKPFLNLCLSVRYLVSNDENGMASTTVSKAMAHNWGISEDDLISAAIKNTNELFGSKIDNMIDLFADTLDIPVDCIEEFFDISLPMYVASNKTGINGATVIATGDCLKQFSYENECNLYLLPSSIHEVILLKDTGKYDAYSLKRLVTEANSTVVKPEDYLSDDVYYYNRETDEITIKEVA